MNDQIEFWQSGEWTMVYLNGELQRAGDDYLADEWLQEHCGVVVVDDKAGSSIPDGYSAVQTLAEARANRDAAVKRASLAEAKRAEARALLAEAKRIEGRKL